VICLSQKLPRLGVEATECLHLNSISHRAGEELAASMAGRLSAPYSPPLLLQLTTRAIGQGANACLN
jgi:hypothetical protein